MAIQQYDILYWDYLNNLYIKLNAQRDRIGLAHVSPNTGLHNYHYAKDISDLNDGINELQANSYLSSVAISNEVPTKQITYITPYYFNKIDEILDNIANTCIYNPCYCDCDCYSDCHSDCHSDCYCDCHTECYCQCSQCDCVNWCHCDHYNPSGDCYSGCTDQGGDCPDRG